MLNAEKIHAVDLDVQSGRTSAIGKICDELGAAGIVVISALEPNGSALLDHALADKGNRHILVLYDPARDAVARGLASSCLLSASLATWKEHAAALLSTYRQHRRRVVFASIAAAQAEPEQFCSLLAQHLGLPQLAAREAPAAPIWTAWQAVLARQAVQNDPVAQALDNELEAASISLPLLEWDADSAVAEFEDVAAARSRGDAERRELIARLEVFEADLATAEQKRSDLEKERELLIQQLAYMQEALLEQLRATANEQKSLAEVRQEVTAAKQLISKLQARIDEQSKKSALPIADAVNAQYENSSYYSATHEIGEVVAVILQSPGWNILPARFRRRWQMNIIGKSGLVEADWYLQQHPDVADAQADPVRHYIEHGAKEGRSPNARYA